MAAPHYLPVHQQLQTHQQFQVITAIPVSIFNFNKPIINMSASADDQYEQQNDFTNDAPAGDSKDNDYVSRTGQYQVPVQKDEVPVADLYDPVTADSDQQLGKSLIASSAEQLLTSRQLRMRTMPSTGATSSRVALEEQPRKPALMLSPVTRKVYQVLMMARLLYASKQRTTAVEWSVEWYDDLAAYLDSALSVHVASGVRSSRHQ